MVQIQRRYALFLFSQGALLVYYLREDEHGVELSVKGNGGTECFTRPMDGFIDYSGLPVSRSVMLESVSVLPAFMLVMHYKLLDNN